MRISSSEGYAELMVCRLSSRDEERLAILEFPDSITSEDDDGTTLGDIIFP